MKRIMVLIGIVLSLLLGHVSFAQDDVPPPTGEIIYQAFDMETQVGSLMIMGADGSNARRLIEDPVAVMTHPTLQHAFPLVVQDLTHDMCFQGLAVLEADAAQLVQIPEPCEAFGGAMRFVDAVNLTFPGGTKIGVISHDEYDLYVYDLRAATATNVTNTVYDPATGAGQELGFSWSPGGDQIAFFDHNGISVMAADGTDRRELIPGASYPLWSPDGNWLSVDVDGAVGAYNFADGTVRILMEGEDVMRLGWSPDSTTIVFRRHRDCAIGTVTLDGEVKVFLQAVGGAYSTPIGWSPDGHYILFAAGEALAEYELFLLNVHDGSVTQITDDDTGKWPIAWLW